MAYVCTYMMQMYHSIIAYVLCVLADLFLSPGTNMDELPIVNAISSSNDSSISTNRSPDTQGEYIYL